MAFDAYFLSAVMDEIREKTAEARVDKIHQPSRDTVILQLKCREGRQKLLFALNPTAPRLHLTASNPENPAEPPMFCMLLRKHLLGARLIKTKQIPMERCAMFTFDCIDEMGDHVNKVLVAELMGRTCNLYLLSPEGRIIDCLRRIGLDETTKRPALPGLLYQEPEAVTKLDPRNLERHHCLLLLFQVPVSARRANRLRLCTRHRNHEQEALCCYCRCCPWLRPCLCTQSVAEGYCPLHPSAA